MKPEDQPGIELVKYRYRYLNLTDEQAEKVSAFEKESDTHSQNHYFSMWEQSDFQHTVFKTFLSEDQFAEYEKNENEFLHQYEQSLVKQDEKYANEITVYE